MENYKVKTVDEYHATFPKKVRVALEVIHKTIQEAAPEAEELISYNMPSFKSHGFLLSYGAWKEHIGLYPAPKATGKFAKLLAAYLSGKATLKFPINEPIPQKLIIKIVKMRIKENRNKLEVKKKSYET